MQVIIVGAGIGGLLTYLSLQKYLSNSLPSLTIKVYESHGSPSSTNSNIGGGLGLAPNGLRAISSVSPKAAHYIQERGYPGAHFTFRNSGGQLLGHLAAGRPERYDGFGQTLLRRAVIHRALLEEMPDEAVIWGKTVKSVKEAEDRAQIEFENGEVETADLVIGADGVRSVVRECILKDQYPATYDGLTGVGGFIPLSRLPPTFLFSLQTEGVNMCFGSHGFFGYSLIGPASPTNPEHSDPHVQWWSIYESPTPPSRSLAPATVRDQLISRHGAWKSPYDTSDARVYESVINLGCNDSNGTLLVLPRYVVPRLPRWTIPSGKIVLLGDAAHAMPPDSGQGVSCAAEDAVALGLLLKHFLISRNLTASEGLARTAKAFEEVRMGRVGKILDIAKRSGDSKKKNGWFKEKVRDSFMWLFCKLPESINDGVFGYDVEIEVEKYIHKQDMISTS